MRKPKRHCCLTSVTTVCPQLCKKICRLCGLAEKKMFWLRESSGKSVNEMKGEGEAFSGIFIFNFFIINYAFLWRPALECEAWSGLDKCWLNKQIMFGHYKVHKSSSSGRGQEAGGECSGWGSNAKARISLSLLILKTRRNYVNKLNCLWPPGARR